MQCWRVDKRSWNCSANLNGRAFDYQEMPRHGDPTLISCSVAERTDVALEIVRRDHRVHMTRRAVHFAFAISHHVDWHAREWRPDLVRKCENDRGERAVTTVTRIELLMAAFAHGLHIKFAVGVRPSGRRVIVWLVTVGLTVTTHRKRQEREGYTPALRGTHARASDHSKLGKMPKKLSTTVRLHGESPRLK